MIIELTRRNFVIAASGSCLAPVAFAGAAPPTASPDGTDTSGTRSVLPAGFPSQDQGLVSDVVGKSHFDFDAVKKLVEARPALAKASYDWGFGDSESALGAASHVGRRDIAELLIAHGARPDIFTFTMFGQLDAVKAIVDANPGIQRIPGPHGITLLAHARAGGEDASEVLAYLESLGDADQVPTDLPLDAQQRAAIIGTYEYEGSAAGAADSSCAIIETKKGGLAFKHGPNGGARNLFHQGNATFHPAGAPKVRIAFADEQLTITDAALAITARRK
jgi:hypothetical protein